MKRLFNLFLVFIFLIICEKTFSKNQLVISKVDKEILQLFPKIEKTFGNSGKTIRKFSPQIIQIANKYHNDPEMLLGIAELLTSGYEMGSEQIKTANKEYKKIIKMKNKEYNKIAYEYFATEPFDKYSNKWWNAWDDLRIDKGFYNKYIKKRGRPPEIDFASNSSDNPSKKEWQNELKADPLMSYLIKKIKPKNTLNRSVKLIPLKNFKQAYSIVREGIKKELYSTIKKIDKYENKDPNNSYYNYLKASLYIQASKYLNQDMTKLITNEIQKGINKKYSIYEKEIVKAKIKVLDKIPDFPWTKKLDSVDVIPAEFIYDKRNIVFDLINIGMNFEKNKNLIEAKKFYDLALKVENQPTKDTISHLNEMSIGDQIFIYRHLRNIYKETKDTQKEKQISNKLKNLKIKLEKKRKEVNVLWFNAYKIFLSNKGQKAIEIYMKIYPKEGEAKTLMKIIRLYSTSKIGQEK